MITFDEIFEAFGGPAQVGRLLDITTEHAVQMRRRGSIPPEHWVRLVEAAREKSIVGVTHETLIAARSSKPPVRGLKQGEAA